ncbi:MAG: hypothetical protein ACR65R_16040 [Methylomicrobium sp.]
MKFPAKLASNLSFFGLLSLGVHAEDQRIYQTDSFGNIQYHQPSHVIQKDGRIIETDPLRNKQYHQPQYQIKGDKIYPTDTFGNIQYDKPSQKIR